MFKNDERYWDINLLNKWFAISSVVFLVVMVCVFMTQLMPSSSYPLRRELKATVYQALR
jgi:hypothetical protein